MGRKTGREPITVALVVVPEATPSVLYGMVEVFSAVGGAWEALTGESNPVRRMRPLLVAESREPIVIQQGVSIAPQATFAETRPDVALVTDLALDMGTDPRGRWSATAEWLRAQYEREAVIGSVCTGSVLLAEAGLLDGLPATTHWSARPLFDAWYPAVRLRPERLLVPAGPAHRVVTSGGYAAWADLVLYLIARFCGRAEAVRIAKVFVLGDRSDGQLPYTSMIRPTGHGDAVIERCQAWIAWHYTDSNPVSGMLAQSGLAERTFKRRFRAATGYTPIEYVQTMRVEEAKQWLETSVASIEDVAASVGYQDVASFRRLFKRMTGITPARYRQRFGGGGGMVQAEVPVERERPPP